MLATNTIAITAAVPATRQTETKRVGAPTWSGRVLTALTGVLMLTSGINLIFVRSRDVMESVAKFGLPEHLLTPIGLAALIGSLLYLIPRTAILGAIVLTGYLGGAVATHARVEDPVFIVPVVVGTLIWAGLLLRNSGLRSLLTAPR